MSEAEISAENFAVTSAVILPHPGEHRPVQTETTNNQFPERLSQWKDKKPSG